MAIKVIQFDEISSTNSPYQTVEFGTSPETGLMMVLNGQLQFAETEEKGYHRALVRPAMRLHKSPRDVLILGGGDGLAVREVLKFPAKSVTLVDIDPVVLQAAKTPPLSRLNQNALFDPRVVVLQKNAVEFLKNTKGRWDVVIADFPDPSYNGIHPLYSSATTRLIAGVLAPGGVVSFHGTSDFKTFAELRQNLSRVFLFVRSGRKNFEFIGDTFFVLAARPKSAGT